ncbi:Gram-negative bacterial tonB protein [compost metagenome]
MIPFNDSPKWIFWKYLIHICLGLVLVYAAYSVKKKAHNTPSINARSVQYLPETLIEKDSLTGPDIFIDPIELQPEFPGGEEQLKKYVSSNMKYPKEALKNNIQGRVAVTFYVDTLGKVKDVRLLKGIGYGCDEEAIRIVKSMPDWIPAIRPVKVQMTLPIMFDLTKNGR